MVEENAIRDGVKRPIPVAFQWSGGKDSALALGRLLADQRYAVRYLATTVAGRPQESTVHRLPVRLLRAQADAIGVPLYPIPLSSTGLDDYVGAMDTAARALYAEGIRAFGVGDLGHSDGFSYKREQFRPLGIDVVAPLQDMTSRECIDDFLLSGIEATTVVVDAAVLDRDYLGRPVTDGFIAALPAGCDPCGEGGEYHTFVSQAPYFRAPVDFTTGAADYIRNSINTTDGPQEFTYWRLRLS